MPEKNKASGSLGKSTDTNLSVPDSYISSFVLDEEEHSTATEPAFPLGSATLASDSNPSSDVQIAPFSTVEESAPAFPTSDPAPNVSPISPVLSISTPVLLEDDPHYINNNYLNNTEVMKYSYSKIEKNEKFLKNIYNNNNDKASNEFFINKNKNKKLSGLKEEEGGQSDTLQGDFRSGRGNKVVKKFEERKQELEPVMEYGPLELNAATIRLKFVLEYLLNNIDNVEVVREKEENFVVFDSNIISLKNGAITNKISVKELLNEVDFSQIYFSQEKLIELSDLFCKVTGNTKELEEINAQINKEKFKLQLAFSKFSKMEVSKEEIENIIKEEENPENISELKDILYRFIRWEKSNKLTDAEKLAIRSYTNVGYIQMNSLLRTGEGDNILINILRIIFTSIGVRNLELSSHQEKILYRTEKKDPIHEIRKKIIKKGELDVISAFMSTSKEKPAFNQECLVMLRDVTNGDITLISSFREKERECLVLPGVKIAWQHTVENGSDIFVGRQYNPLSYQVETFDDIDSDVQDLLDQNHRATIETGVKLSENFNDDFVKFLEKEDLGGQGVGGVYRHKNTGHDFLIKRINTKRTEDRYTAEESISENFRTYDEVLAARILRKLGGSSPEMFVVNNNKGESFVASKMLPLAQDLTAEKFQSLPDAIKESIYSEQVILAWLCNRDTVNERGENYVMDADKQVSQVDFGACLLSGFRSIEVDYKGKKDELNFLEGNPLNLLPWVEGERDNHASLSRTDGKVITLRNKERYSKFFEFNGGRSFLNQRSSFLQGVLRVCNISDDELNEIINESLHSDTDKEKIKQGLSRRKKLLIEHAKEKYGVNSLEEEQLSLELRQVLHKLGLFRQTTITDRVVGDAGVAWRCQVQNALKPEVRIQENGQVILNSGFKTELMLQKLSEIGINVEDNLNFYELQSKVRQVIISNSLQTLFGSYDIFKDGISERNAKFPENPFKGSCINGYKPEVLINGHEVIVKIDETKVSRERLQKLLLEVYGLSINVDYLINENGEYIFNNLEKLVYIVQSKIGARKVAVVSENKEGAILAGKLKKELKGTEGFATAGGNADRPLNPKKSAKEEGSDEFGYGILEEGLYPIGSTVASRVPNIFLAREGYTLENKERVGYQEFEEESVKYYSFADLRVANIDNKDAKFDRTSVAYYLRYYQRAIQLELQKNGIEHFIVECSVEPKTLGLIYIKPSLESNLLEHNNKLRSYLENMGVRFETQSNGIFQISPKVSPLYFLKAIKGCIHKSDFDMRIMHQTGWLNNCGASSLSTMFKKVLLEGKIEHLLETPIYQDLLEVYNKFYNRTAENKLNFEHMKQHLMHYTNPKDIEVVFSNVMRKFLAKVLYDKGIISQNRFDKLSDITKETMFISDEIQYVLGQLGVSSAIYYRARDKAMEINSPVAPVATAVIVNDNIHFELVADTQEEAESHNERYFGEQQLGYIRDIRSSDVKKMTLESQSELLDSIVAEYALDSDTVMENTDVEGTLLKLGYPRLLVDYISSLDDIKTVPAAINFIMIYSEDNNKLFKILRKNDLAIKFEQKDEKFNNAIDRCKTIFEQIEGDYNRLKVSHGEFVTRIRTMPNNSARAYKQEIADSFIAKINDIKNQNIDAKCQEAFDSARELGLSAYESLQAIVISLIAVFDELSIEQRLNEPERHYDEISEKFQKVFNMLNEESRDIIFQETNDFKSTYDLTKKHNKNDINIPEYVNVGTVEIPEEFFASIATSSGANFQTYNYFADKYKKDTYADMVDEDETEEELMYEKEMTKEKMDFLIIDKKINNIFKNTDDMLVYFKEKIKEYTPKDQEIIKTYLKII